MKAKSQLIGRSLAFGLFLLAAAFGFAGSAGAQAYASETAAPDGNANVAETPGNIVCVTFAGLKPEFENAQRQVEAAESALAEIDAAEAADLAKWAANPGGGETCAVEAQSEPLAESPTAETDQVSAVVIGEAVPPSDALPAIESDDAIVVEITQTVTIVVPGQIVEDNEGPTNTGSIILEPSVILDAETTDLDDPD
jgi:hypothetical protein